MKKILLLFLLLPLVAMTQPKQMLSFSFALPAAATVSAGVYKGDVLIRTLFNNKKYSAGTHNEQFDAIDDEMKPIQNTEGLKVKVLSNNVKYEWEGVIGNTSADMSGLFMHRGFMSFYYLIVNGKKAYYSKYYSEGSPAQNMFELDNIQRKTRLFPDEPKGVGQATAAIATDGVKVYWGGLDPNGGRTKGSIKYANYVFATMVSDDSEASFSKGVSYKNGIGRTYRSAVDLTTDSLAAITGLAVQKRGKFLFVSHGYELHVVDKNTGELLKAITMPTAALAVDMKDNLWVVTGNLVKKYSVNDDADITELFSLPEFIKPVAVAVSPDNNTVVVADAGTSQQLKSFNNNSGSSGWTFGQAGGYYKSATVANDKFYFSDNRMTYGVSISFQNDGSFWLVDGGNSRTLHYSADRKFIDHIMYLPHNYNIYVDTKAPQRVFCDYMEFAVDYSKPLAPDNNSWSYVNNWGALITRDIQNKFLTLRPIKLSNGKTYTLMMDNKTKRYQVVELTAQSLLRFTGVFLEAGTEKYLNADGNIYTMPRKKNGTSMIFTRQQLRGFDANNNPEWGTEETIATINNPGEDDPVYSGNVSTLRPGEKTTSNILLVFNGSSKGEGYHLGGIKLGDAKWTWRSAKGTSKSYKGAFPTDGSYDIGNGVQYAGNVALAIDRNIFWGYHGEFWKNSQTNKWNHLYDDGLMIGQFGVTGPEVAGQEAAPGMAGNVSAASVVKVGDNLYLYHNDEGHHSGVHRWKITGLNTIDEQSVAVIMAEKKENNAKRRPLMGEQPLNKSYDDILDGWKKEPANDIVADKNKNWWTVTAGSKSYNKFESPDINIRFRQSIPATASLSKDLGTNNSNNWNLSGELNYDENYPEQEVKKPGDKSTGGQYFEVLDNKGKIIFRFFPTLNSTTKAIRLIANNNVIAENDRKIIGKELSDFQPFTLKVSNGKMFFKYASFEEKEIPVFETSANIKTPATVRFYFWARTSGSNRVVSFKKIDFDAD